MTIGQRINLERQKRDISIDELADLTRISRNTIVSWIYRGYHPDIDFLIAIADVFEITLDELVGREYPRKTK